MTRRGRGRSDGAETYPIARDHSTPHRPASAARPIPGVDVGHLTARSARRSDRLKRIGFTHVLGLGADYDRIWQAGAPTEAAAPQAVAQTRRMLDDALANDLTVVASLSPGSLAAEPRSPSAAWTAKGRPTNRRTSAACSRRCSRSAGTWACRWRGRYGDHPAFGAALIHTEVRDHAQPCFHPHDAPPFGTPPGSTCLPKPAAARASTTTESPISPRRESSPTTIRCTSTIAGIGSRATAGTA